MVYFATAVVSFLVGVIATLIFRIPVKKKLAAERDQLKAAAQNTLGKL